MRWLLVLAVAACSKGPPTCEDVARHLESTVFAPGESAERGRVEHHDLILARCTKDGWSDEARACLVAKSPDDAADCDDKLTPAQVSATTVTVKAPPRGVAPVEEPAPALVVTIDAAGHMYLGGMATDEDHLRSSLHDLAVHDPERQIVIRADKQTPHGQVVHVMELAKNAGLNRLAISTAP